MARRPAKKKHRGIRDPLKLIEERNRKLKDKINRKPSNDAAQEIPRSLQRIVKFQENLNKQGGKNTQGKKEVESKKKKKRKKKKNDVLELIDTAKLISLEKEQPGMTRPLQMIPRLIQNQGETDAQFMQRVQSATWTIVSESKFEDKYKVDVERDATGSVSNVKRRNPLDDPLLADKKRAKLEKKEALKKEKKKERDYQRKHRNKKKEEDDDDDEFKYFQDKVEFGEVVYEPPSLDTSKLTKMAGGDTKTKSFIFMEKLKASQAGKMPEMTVSRKRVLEEERLKAVQAYREMKAAKFSQNQGIPYG